MRSSYASHWRSLRPRDLPFFFDLIQSTYPHALGQSQDLGQDCPIRLTYLRCTMFVAFAHLPPRSFWGSFASVMSARFVLPVLSVPEKFIG